ncbi:hypothetical protein SAMN05444166_4225 [Singulisphaera sp. GP187]|uniref:hypothetical protein n=1 Tax=Singulisphaera sp. GP187 TaxID=1882752 RepID=UPI000925E436|nr:hypothetical protein [Singulisphaera sp. GP187]SIO37889.1 hypothetical protein SAMN05444166_4225 [Singulisphaera sp. GP187]
MPSEKTAKPAPGVAAEPPKYVSPRPPAVVLWRNAPGGDAYPAIVTQVGRHAISVMLFPPESRVGVPKDGVRHVGDPWNKQHGINADSGVWDYTDETKLIRALAASKIPGLDGNVQPLAQEASVILASYLR